LTAKPIHSSTPNSASSQNSARLAHYSQQAKSAENTEEERVHSMCHVGTEMEQGVVPVVSAALDINGALEVGMRDWIDFQLFSCVHRVRAGKE